jgi:hypothetical protein
MYHFRSEAFHYQDTKIQRILGVLVVDSKTQIFILNFGIIYLLIQATAGKSHNSADHEPHTHLRSPSLTLTRELSWHPSRIFICLCPIPVRYSNLETQSDPETQKAGSVHPALLSGYGIAMTSC